MDSDFAVKIINRLLREKRPVTFNSSWILKHAPYVYQYFQKNVRVESGGIDLDRATRALDRRFHRKWKPAYRNRSIAYSVVIFCESKVVYRNDKCHSKSVAFHIIELNK